MALIEIILSEKAMFHRLPKVWRTALMKSEVIESSEYETKHITFTVTQNAQTRPV